MQKGKKRKRKETSETSSLCISALMAAFFLSLQGFPGDLGDRGPAGLDGSPVSTLCWVPPDIRALLALCSKCMCILVSMFTNSRAARFPGLCTHSSLPVLNMRKNPKLFEKPPPWQVIIKMNHFSHVWVSWINMTGTLTFIREGSNHAAQLCTEVFYLGSFTCHCSDWKTFHNVFMMTHHIMIFMIMK